jgi:hypothetical protein
MGRIHVAVHCPFSRLSGGSSHESHAGKQECRDRADRHDGVSVHIAIGLIVGIQTAASRTLRAWASWLAVTGVVLYPIRDAVYFWGRWLNPNFSPHAPGYVLYPIMWVAGSAMFLALLCALLVFVQGARQAAAK